MTDTFDLERSQSYWRFIPSGEGKHNSAELAQLPGDELQGIWRRAFASRFHRYPEEDCFVQVMAESFRDRDVLSIGSGMGFHEIYYQRHDARVTCCDIVESNLDVIRRVCALNGLPPIQTILSGEASGPRFDRPFDVGFVYGSLMTMPPDKQRRLLSHVRSALEPDGEMVLMLYTWKFVESTCGWKSPAEFDPTVFARASDPSVEEEHCPWSDWHDDRKLLGLVGPGMRITRRQLWQQGLFVWYALEFGETDEEPTEFFDQDRLLDGVERVDLPLGAFEAAAARVTEGEDGLLIETEEGPFGYALVFPPYNPSSAAVQPNALRADISLLNGGISVGLLDVASQTFLNTASTTDPGRHGLIVPLPSELSDCQVIFSNHRTDGSGSSSFLLHHVEFVERSSVIGESWRPG